MHNTLFKMMLVGLLLLGIGNTTTAHAAPTLEETKKYLSDRLYQNEGKTLEFNLEGKDKEGKDKCNFYVSGSILGDDPFYEYIKLSSIYYESITYKNYDSIVGVNFIRDPSSPNCGFYTSDADKKFHWGDYDQNRWTCNWIRFGQYDGKQLAKAVKHAAKLCGAKPKPEILFE